MTLKEEAGHKFADLKPSTSKHNQLPTFSSILWFFFHEVEGGPKMVRRGWESSYGMWLPLRKDAIHEKGDGAHFNNGVLASKSW